VRGWVRVGGTPPNANSWIHPPDDVDTIFHLGGRNVLKTFEMATRHHRRANGIGESFLSLDLISLKLRSIIFFWFSYGRRSPPIAS